jgi:2-haloacid dehalogenase
MTQAVVCDVNETLLDLGALDPLFADWFGTPDARREWFALTLHYAMTLAATREYRDFGEVGAAALAGVARRRNVPLPADARQRLRQGVIALPPHPDVEPALRILRAAGFVTAALSNNPLATLAAQMDGTGLMPLFDQIVSVEEAGALKPAPEVYRYVAKRLALPVGSLWMVAAHGWDLAGAARAGVRGAFVARPGQTPDPFAPPDITGADLGEVAALITATASMPTA